MGGEVILSSLRRWSHSFQPGRRSVGHYIVVSDEAALVMTSGMGQVVMCLQAGAGSLLGLPAIVGNEPYTPTAMAGKVSKIKFLTRAGFEDVARPSFYQNVFAG